MENEKRVVLVNRAVYLPGEGGYKRTMYLFDMMRNSGYHPILLTSDFNHYKKEQRNIEEFKRAYPQYADGIEFIRTSTYKKNISIKRYFTEKEWTRKVKEWFMQNAGNVDVVMLSMPDMNTILAIRGICEKNNIEMIIDVRDLRPEAFRVIVKNEMLYNILFYLMKKKANRAYSCADKLFAVSEEYLERALQVNKKATLRKAIYIGAALKKFDIGVQKYSDEISKGNEIWITYAGTLGESYDLYTVIDAASKIKDSGKTNIKFMLLGQGPDEASLREYAKSVGADNVEFVGFVEYEKMAAYLNKSDITINAIKKRGSQSIINKVADYFAAGIPMLNGCICKEQMQMVEKYKVGINYEPENEDSLIKAINELLENPGKCKLFGRNARKLAEQQFDRDYSYLEIINGIYD